MLFRSAGVLDGLALGRALVAGAVLLLEVVFLSDELPPAELELLPISISLCRKRVVFHHSLLLRNTLVIAGLPHSYCKVSKTI